jgi:hypothetical protein
MAVFNKVVVILLLLVLIPVVTVGLIVPREAVQLLSDTLDNLDERLDTSVSTLELVIRATIALLIDCLLVVLLYLEVRRPARQGVRVRQVEGGEAQIAVESIVDRLTYHIDPLPGVLEVKPKVSPRRGGVEVALDVEMAADINMPDNIETISRVARDVVEGEMGLKLKGKPKLNLRTVLYPEQPTPGLEYPAPADVTGEAIEPQAETAASEEESLSLPEGEDTETKGADEPE